MCGVGAVEGGLPLGADLFGCSEVDGGRGVQADTGVTVFMVVAQEETVAEGAGVL